ncbi:MAG: hypothetical protein A2289_26240 [Deltaproteobacteria bacterium RIFOXYA12_FULL_58_15]|nr:MAG: hypothetical protein A2289_26240 [Deltaproteobacteria bacterium RIFOXYA12_FULL_58_15]OGR13839.1 MAG: hypothetical protein A2341_01465 [Deltaproteobacteria bacterium RIFOXYB12_FULL_58_9]
MLDRKNRAWLIVAADYEAFGKAWEYLPESTSPPTVEVNLRFPGQYLDRETGLHYNGARYYDPNTGRYLTPEPMLTNPSAIRYAVQGYASGPLPAYSYALSNPQVYADPNGYHPVAVAVGLGAAAAALYNYLKASWIVDEAINDADSRYDDGTVEGAGRADAYRHCMASCEMAMNYGEGLAEMAGDGWESWYNRNAAPEKQADFSNNSCGRQLSRGADSYTDCASACADALEGGGLNSNWQWN